MPKVIIITDVDLEGYYNYTMEYLDAKYHRFPTNFQDFQISDQAAAQISSLNSMASHMSIHAGNPSVSIGKLVL